MIRKFALLAAMLPAAAHAQPATSAYSPLNIDRCTLIEEIEEGSHAGRRQTARTGKAEQRPGVH